MKRLPGSAAGPAKGLFTFCLALLTACGAAAPAVTEVPSLPITETLVPAAADLPALPAASPSPETGTPIPTAAAVPAPAETIPVDLGLDLAAVEAANSYPSLAGRHTSIQVESSIYAASGAPLVEAMVLGTADMVYEDLNGNFLMLRDGLELSILSEGDFSAPAATVYFDDSAYQEELAWARESLSARFDGESVAEAWNEDGALHLMTELDAPETVAEDLAVFGWAYQPGDTLVFRYVLDPAYLEIHTEETRVRRGAEELLLERSTYRYDLNFSPEATVFAAYFTGERVRNLSFTFAPGQSSQRTKTVALPKSFYFRVWSEGTYVPIYYTDPDCIEVFTGSNPEDDSDLHLYFPSVSPVSGPAAP